jgi:hypothetical protein
MGCGAYAQEWHSTLWSTSTRPLGRFLAEVPFGARLLSVRCCMLTATRDGGILVRAERLGLVVLGLAAAFGAAGLLAPSPNLASTCFSVGGALVIAALLLMLVRGLDASQGRVGGGRLRRAPSGASEPRDRIPAPRLPKAGVVDLTNDERLHVACVSIPVD